MKITIIGGGIGGLSAALHLLKAGLDVHVYEQSPRIGEIGAGIQISPNASRLLIRLGLKPALDSAGVRPLAVHQRRWDDGRTLQRAPIGPEVEATFGAPYYHLHRGDLAELLGAAVPAERLHVGHRLVGLEQKGERIVARFENGRWPNRIFWSAPTASIPGCAISPSARRSRASPAASPGAGWCRPSA